jgi:NADH:ubiquinone oxidoreductase subunit E
MSKFPIPDTVLYVCTGSKCAKKGGKSMYKTARVLAKYDRSFEVVRTECTDRCDWAPVCAIQPGNTWLKEYAEKDVLKLLQQQMQEQKD